MQLLWPIMVFLVPAHLCPRMAESIAIWLGVFHLGHADKLAGIVFRTGCSSRMPAYVGSNLKTCGHAAWVSLVRQA